MPIVLTPSITTVDGSPLVGRRRAVAFDAGTGPTLRVQMLDPAGDPLDLTPYMVPSAGTVPGDVLEEDGGRLLLEDGSTGLAPAPPTSPLVQFRAVEAINLGRGSATFPGRVEGDPAQGWVTTVVDPVQLGVPGVYDAGFAVLTPAGVPVSVQSLTLLLEPNLFTSTPFGGCGGPPRRDEVRLHIRDSSPAENRLLVDTPAFDDAEIGQAIVKAVQYWNAALPPVSLFSTASFPPQFRYPWLEAVAAQLLFTAAEWYRRNYLPLQAQGGVGVPDMDKADTCDKAADRRWQQYQAWVRSQKIAINVSRGFGRLGSPYRMISWGGIMNY